MRKFISAAILAAALLALGGCGNSKDNAPEATTAAESQIGQSQTINIDAGEYLQLCEYKGLTVERTPVELTDDEVE